MGQYFSSQKEEAVSRQRVAVPRQEVQVEIVNTYEKCEKPPDKKTKRKERSIDTKLIPVAIKPTKKGIGRIMLRISQNPIIKMDSVLVVAKGTVFENNGIARQFSHSLTSMIMETRTAQGMVQAYHYPEVACRFLKILVTTGDDYFLMPSVAPTPVEPNNWAENLFADILNLNGDKFVVLSYILSIVKQHKRLINKNENFIFCLDIILNKNRQGHDKFHQDDDQFGDYQGGKPIYISTTNISQQSEFKLSTQIRISQSEKLYTLASRLGEFTLLNNNLLQHRTPPEINTRGPTITNAKYEVADRMGTGNIPSYNMSSLSNLDPVVLENYPDIVKLNSDLNSPDPRNLLRILVKTSNGIDVTGLPDITHLVPSDTFISPSVIYKGTVSDRNPDSEDNKKMVNLLKDHSIGGKSKKKLRKRKKLSKKKRVVRKNYSYGQRGGAGDLSDLKYLNEYFAIYADPETACLIENNIEVII